MGKNLIDKYASALTKLGAVEKPSKSRKYRVFFAENLIGFKPFPEPRYFFLGKAGAIRVSTSSIPVPESFKKRILPD